MSDSEDVTRLLHRARGGDSGAVHRLLPLVYDELRAIARRQLRGATGGTLSATVVVHEAYLKIGGERGLAARDRGHFFAVAATAMRQVAIDHARERSAKKRGGGAPHTLLDGHDLPVESRAEELLVLDDALTRLASLDERAARVVELRFFAGLDVEETADALDVSTPTVKRDWRRARAFLYHELGGEE